MQYVIGVMLVVAVLIACLWRWSEMTKAERTELFDNAVEKIKGYILDLVFDAEKLYQSGTGQFKKAYVINQILNGEFYKGLPLFVQKMVTFSVLSELVDNIVQNVFNVVKESNKELQNRLTK